MVEDFGSAYVVGDSDGGLASRRHGDLSIPDEEFKFGVEFATTDGTPIVDRPVAIPHVEIDDHVIDVVREIEQVSDECPFGGICVI